MTPPSGTQTDPSHRMAGLAAVQTEQLFRAIFEQAAVGIALIETATGRFLRINQRYCEIVGLLRDKMTAATFMAITHPEDLQADLRNMEELKAGRIHDFSMEKRYFRPDGSIVWVDLTVASLWEAGEQPSFHIAVVQDITERKQAEQNLAQLNATLEQQVAERTRELEEKRQQLQAILDGTSDAVFVKDLEGRYRLINNAAGRFVGKRQDEVLGRDDRFIFPPAEAQAVMEGDRKVMTDGVTATYEDVATTADGVQRTFLSTKGPLFDGQGRVTGLFGISRDITARKHAEKALRESEERFRRIFEHAGTGIAITDLNGRFLRCNPAYCALFGYTEAELREFDFRQVVHPQDLASNLVEADKLYAQEVLFFEIESRYRHKDGHEVWVRKFESMLRDDFGEPMNLFALVTDITERRQAQELLEQRVAERTEALRDSEHFTKEVLDSLTAHVAVLDASGVIVAVNRIWERAALLNDPSGLARVSLGSNYVKVCERAADKSSEARRTLDGILDVLAGRNNVFESEYLCVWPGGQQQWFSMRVTPLSDRGGCVVAHEDITARKCAEEAVRESYHRLQTVSREVQMAEERERSRLSRELHDEFGQLLSVLKLTLSATERSLRKKTAKPASLAKQVKGTIETVDQLFVSLHGMVAALRPAVLEELGLVASLKALAADVAQPSGIRCRVVVKHKGLPTLFPPTIDGALYRITQELLTNVVRHAHATAATITLSSSKENVKLVVQDDGRGFRVDKVPSKGRFGLRGICERVELLGGTVEIHTKPGRTAVTVCVPLGIPPLNKRATVSSPVSMLATAKKKRRYAQIM